MLPTVNNAQPHSREADRSRLESLVDQLRLSIKAAIKPYT